MDIGTMEGLVTGLSVVAACMAWAVWGTAGQHARTLARKLARLEVALASDRLDLLELPEASDLVTWAEALALVPAGVRGSFGEPGDPTDVAPTTEDLTYRRACPCEQCTSKRRAARLYRPGWEKIYARAR
jgi:hypothetical protein